MGRLNTKLLGVNYAFDVVSFIARFGMAAVWIIAGIEKTTHPLDTMQSIKAYEIFTLEWSGYLAQLIGPLELVGGMLLLLGIFLRESSKVAAVVMVLFMVGILQAWLRGLDIDCGCFGAADATADPRMNYGLTLLRDVAFLFLTAWTIKRPFTKFALHP
ncbi:DoxX family membrane protein [Corynebacterium macginleyi]|nr:DoxX family membrane protein [Corynebacterium macginleyi]MBK4166315.1 DoxX family membrane protein [Corynebacterium macginleyi]